MANLHGVVKSGQSRNVNMRGATDRMVEHVDRHHSTFKPVSINYLRGLVKTYNRQIDATNNDGSLVYDSATRARLIFKREHTYNTIKMLQAAYEVRDSHQVALALQYARLNGVVIPGDYAVTARYTADAVQRIAANLGSGFYDASGNHHVTVEGKPRIPGGYATKDAFGHIIPKDEVRKMAKPITGTSDELAPSRLQNYLQRVVRPDRRKDVGPNKNPDGSVVPNPPRFKDSDRLGDGFKAGKVVSPATTVKAIKVSLKGDKPVVSGNGGAVEFLMASRTWENKAKTADNDKSRAIAVSKALVLAQHSRIIAGNYQRNNIAVIGKGE